MLRQRPCKTGYHLVVSVLYYGSRISCCLRVHFLLTQRSSRAAQKTVLHGIPNMERSVSPGIRRVITLW